MSEIRTAHDPQAVEDFERQLADTIEHFSQHESALEDGARAQVESIYEDALAAGANDRQAVLMTFAALISDSLPMDVLTGTVDASDLDHHIAALVYLWR